MRHPTWANYSICLLLYSHVDESFLLVVEVSSVLGQILFSEEADELSIKIYLARKRVNENPEKQTLRMLKLQGSKEVRFPAALGALLWKPSLGKALF